MLGIFGDYFFNAKNFLNDSSEEAFLSLMTDIRQEPFQKRGDNKIHNDLEPMVKKAIEIGLRAKSLVMNRFSRSYENRINLLN